MSENINTNEAENLNEEPMVTVKVPIKEIDAENILASLGASFPHVSDIDVIQLVIVREKNA